MRTNNWAIQISRSIYDSEIWRKPSDWLKIWLYILWSVNFKDNNDFKRWENFFRYEIISLECWVSYNTVVKCIKYLKSATQVQVKKTTRGAIISVTNYDKYQELSNYGNTEATQKQDKSNWSTNTIIEERKNVIKKEVYIWANRSEVLEELDKIIVHWNNTWKEERIITKKLEDVYLKIRKTYSKDVIASALTTYKDEKIDTERQYRLDPMRFFTQANWFLTYV
jgi:hypothetical protein